MHMLKHLQASQGWDDKNTLQKGFTLVELLVVIVILGILAAVVVFAVNGIQDRGNASACSTDAGTVRTAIEAYRANHLATDNPTMANLVSGHLLSKASTLVTITYVGATQDYTIDGVNGAGKPCNGMTNL
jgi:prepilin-type N-terminal cleavage/methylation domain-containing protein